MLRRSHPRGGKGSLRAPGVPGFGAVARISDQLLAAGAAMCVEWIRIVVALMVSETDIILYNIILYLNMCIYIYV